MLVVFRTVANVTFALIDVLAQFDPMWEDIANRLTPWIWLFYGAFGGLIGVFLNAGRRELEVAREIDEVFAEFSDSENDQEEQQAVLDH